MPRFRSKPAEIEAVQWIPGEAPPRGVCECGDCGTPRVDVCEKPHVHTAQGQTVHVAPTEWIVAEPDGRGFYPIADDIFASKYVPASPATSTKEGE